MFQTEKVGDKPSTKMGWFDHSPLSRSILSRYGLWLLDGLVLATVVLLIFADAKIFYFHLVFVFLTFGAFFWELRSFIIRAGFWVAVVAAIVLRLISQHVVHTEELIEIPMLTGILVLVFAIAKRRARAEDALREVNEALEARVAERTVALTEVNRDLLGEISERKQTEQTLRESEERYRRLVELAFETVVVHQDNKIVFLNPAGMKLVDARGPEEVIGKSLLDFVDPDFLDIARERIHQIQDGVQGVPLVEQKLVRLDGTSVDVELITIPISYQGTPALQTVIRDISERKQAEMARIAERTRIARDLHDSLGQDLGYLHLKLDELTNSESIKLIPEREQDVTQMRNVAHDAYELVRELLASFLPSNSTSLATVLKDLGKSIGRQNQFSFQLIEHGSASRLSGVLQQQLVYICREALTNVRKHANAKHVEIELAWVEDLLVNISDDGCGFDVEAERDTRNLGLQIMNERAKQLGAKFSIQSILGVGTVVTVYVPLDK